jgi:hypothetical protein
MMPIDGGATCPGYTWTQNGIEVTVAFSIPQEVSRKHISVALQPDRLRVSYKLGEEDVFLTDSPLPARVRSLTPDGGSYWEINRSKGLSTICVVLEKEKQATSIKWGFWRSMFPGHPEIDTHAIDSALHVKESSPVAPTPDFNLTKLAREDYESMRKRLQRMDISELDELPDQFRPK